MRTIMSPIPRVSFAAVCFLAALAIAAILPPEASAAAGDLRLKTQISPSYISSSPALTPDGTLYFGSSDSFVYAVDAKGVARKFYDTDGSVDDSPAVGSDGTVYFGSFDMYVYAVRPDGTLKWKYKTGGLIRCTPAIGADGTVYIGSYDSTFYALNPAGAVRWTYRTGNGIASSPAIGVDGTIYFASRDKSIYALNPDGSLKWKVPTGAEIHWSSAALDTDGTLYIGSNDGFVYAIDSGGVIRWRYRTGGAVGSSPAIGPDGTVYVESCDSYLYALKPDGALKWRFPVGNTSFGCHPVVGSDGTVYIGSTDKNLYAVGSDGSLKWKYQTGGAFWTTGATIDDRGILSCVSSDGCLYTFDTGTGAGVADTPWPKFHGNVRNTGAFESFAVNPGRLVFSGVPSGGTGSGTVGVVNRGSSPLTVEGIASDDPAFSATPASLVVTPGGKGDIQVLFSPRDTGEHRATLAMTAGGRTVRIGLSGNPPPEPVPVGLRIKTTDGDTGEALPCRIFLIDSLGRSVLPGGVLSTDWMFFVSPGDIRVTLFSGTYTLSIGRGNEYTPLVNEPVVVPAQTGDVVIERSLKRWIHMKELGWFSCDNQVNNYDDRPPDKLYPYQLAEDLNILHLICLGDGTFTANHKYFQKDVFGFSKPFHPMIIGEEWRSRTWQNHMVLMGHSHLVSVWGNGFYDSTGPYPYSYPPALDIADETHRYGGIVTGTHPFWYEPFTGMDNVYVNRNLAFELPADVALGKIDGMQIYMYWQYDEWNRWVWYRLLNCGFRIPPFAGTDALLNKMSAVKSVMDPLAGRVRSYAYVPDQKTGLDARAWLDASAKGRSFVSSGAALFFTVNGELPGSEIGLDAPGGKARVTVEAEARWLGGLEKVVFIVNGKTAAERTLSGESAAVKLDLELAGSSWIACRVEGKPFDQFEGDAHSGPVYVTLSGAPIRSPDDARYFANWIDRHIALLDSARHFGTEEQRTRTFELYRKAKDVYLTLAGDRPLAAGETLPGEFSLFPASPNPFNASTVLSYVLPNRCAVTLEVYDILGRRVKVLERGPREKGLHRSMWDGTDERGRAVGSGVYLLRLGADAAVLHGKALVMR